MGSANEWDTSTELSFLLISWSISRMLLRTV